MVLITTTTLKKFQILIFFYLCRSLYTVTGSIPFGCTFGVQVSFYLYFCTNLVYIMNALFTNIRMLSPCVF